MLHFVGQLLIQINDTQNHKHKNCQLLKRNSARWSLLVGDKENYSNVIQAIASTALGHKTIVQKHIILQIISNMIQN